ncbi:Alpha/Beta hydrolase protein [Dactylonectria macrodidyma]|uniref:Alpha/Beta hydrolase protein n=1 Tax=Dactylonectria macrodidyma TaxID=307937 RepID=A0A9P9ELQ3_9HYPO|nr:Alpha/Beta hydrolase protein [Dactylonectria macrodidyma]
MGLEVDQEFLSALRPFLQSQQGVSNPRIPANVIFEIIHIPTEDGFQLPIYHFKRADAATAKVLSAAVIHAHGGGLIALSPEISIQRLSDIVSETGVQAFSVDYRLAPEHPYPTALNDCWACLTWLHMNAEVLHVDPKRIAVMGESAGGGLVAALTLRARDVNLSPPIARQILSSPMLDDRTSRDVPGDFKLWDTEDNLTAWTAYLGRTPGGEDVPIFAAPGRLEDAAGLPPIYLDTSQFDLFVLENLNYAQKFVEAGIETESHLYPGLPHGFDGLLPTHRVSQQLEENRKRIMRSL